MLKNYELNFDFDKISRKSNLICNFSSFQFSCSLLKCSNSKDLTLFLKFFFCIKRVLAKPTASRFLENEIFRKIFTGFNLFYYRILCETKYYISFITVFSVKLKFFFCLSHVMSVSLIKTVSISLSVFSF